MGYFTRKNQYTKSFTMSSNKETILRFPGSTDPKFAAKPSQSQSQSQGWSEQDSSKWSPIQSFSSHMDSQGHPVADPIGGKDGPMKGQKKGHIDENSDLFDAMNAETEDFD
ncbi:unnamed protein product [Penicillium manginii]